MTIRSGGDGDNAAEGNRGLARMLSPPGGPRSISHVRHTGQRSRPRAAGARPVTAGARSGLRGVAVQPLAPSLREPRCCIVLSGGSRCLHFPPSQRESNLVVVSFCPSFTDPVF